jgi:hypothetical protein
MKSLLKLITSNESNNSEESINNKQRILPLRIILFVVSCSFPIMIIISYLTLWKFRGNIYKVNTIEFLSSAMWAQVLIAIVGALISYYLLKQISLVQEQIQLSRKTSTAESAKILTSKRSINVRRFLNQDKAKKYFAKLTTDHICHILDENGDLKFDKNKFDSELKIIRNEISKLSQEIFPEQKIITLDDIEYLLNEYNYIGMLIEHKVFDVPLITSMAKDNAINIYEIVIPYINFRRQTAAHNKGYASHYIKWIEGPEHKDNN